MTVTVGLFDAGYTRLKDRIDAMGLDIEIRAFDEDGNFDIGGAKVPAADAEIDYLWLGPDRRRFARQLALRRGAGL